MQGDEAGQGLLLTAFSILYFFADSYRFLLGFFFFACLRTCMNTVIFP